MKRNIAEQRDNVLVDFLKQHKGRHNIVSSDTVVEFLNDAGFSLTRTSVTPTMRKLMYERNLPVCFVSTEGYYWGETNEEFLGSIADIEKKIEGCRKHVEHLKQFIK